MAEGHIHVHRQCIFLLVMGSNVNTVQEVVDVMVDDGYLNYFLQIKNPPAFTT